MKIDLIYPKIPDSRNFLPKQCIAFEKYDGTNLHWSWSPTLGWFEFGTRRDSYGFTVAEMTEFAKNHGMCEAVDIFGNDIEKKLEEFFFSNKRYSQSQVTVFTEFLGPNSFAGQHQNDDEKRLIIFDVQVNGKMLEPKILLKDFSSFIVADVIYQGKYTGQLVEDIRNGNYKVKEGAVIKGIHKGEVYMAKVKTNTYMERLKESFKNEWSNYWE